MADCKNRQGTETPEKTQNETNKSALFNRSVTMNSSSASITNTSLHNLYTAPAFQRKGSFKNLYSSSLVSMVSAGNSFKGKFQKIRSIFETPKNPSNPPNLPFLPLPTKPTNLLLKDSNSNPIHIPRSLPDSPFRLPGTENRVVIYFTSLRGIRKTFNDCHSVRMIFNGFRVILDERDVSIDLAYRRELQKLLGESNPTLPQVFVKGKYVGGADVIKGLLEAGELVRLLKGLPLRAPKPCELCGDARFVPCGNCDGSRKIFDEEEDRSVRCMECNENGLVRCFNCVS